MVSHCRQCAHNIVYALFEIRVVESFNQCGSKAFCPAIFAVIWILIWVWFEVGLGKRGVEQGSVV